jgi:hypothetical protein
MPSDAVAAALQERLGLITREGWDAVFRRRGGRVAVLAGVWDVWGAYALYRRVATGLQFPLIIEGCFASPRLGIALGVAGTSGRAAACAESAAPVPVLALAPGLV